MNAVNLPARWKAFILSTLIALAGCSGNGARSAQPLLHPHMLSTTQSYSGELDHISYAGHWEMVRNRHDGRFHGASARSFHTSDALTLLFDGDQFRVYGIAGPNGGQGTVVMSGQRAATISFHSPVKRVHALLFESPRFGPGIHSASIVVVAGYVNIDAVEIIRARRRGEVANGDATS
jgi:hypothetical protein